MYMTKCNKFNYLLYTIFTYQEDPRIDRTGTNTRPRYGHMTARQQCVRYHSTCSDWSTLHAGVPTRNKIRPNYIFSHD